jgi:hypothetical protein
MTIAEQHIFSPEDIMAFFDGEVSAAESRTIAAHLDECAECAAIADQFRATAQALAAWTIPAPSETLDSAVYDKSRQAAARRNWNLPPLSQPTFSTWQRWALGSGCILTVLFLIGMFFTRPSYKAVPPSQMMKQEEHLDAARGLSVRIPQPNAITIAPPPGITDSDIGMLQKKTALTSSSAQTTYNAAAAKPTPAASFSPSTPMISHTVSLMIQVKDISQSRAAVDAILARHQGYSAQLNINTSESDMRTVGASLRIPAPALSAALAELRSLGRVQTESQSGEEVTAQHADLMARLNNARETEQRLRAILQQRTGKVEEVLQVEEQISSTRGEIERMEAEQKALEHRVDFATVQLQLIEEFKAQFVPPVTSVGTRMHNSFVTGMDNAGSSILGILLFFEEYGPVLLVWAAIIAAPVWMLRRRYRRTQSRI